MANIHIDDFDASTGTGTVTLITPSDTYLLAKQAFRLTDAQRAAIMAGAFDADEASEQRKQALDSLTMRVVRMFHSNKFGNAYISAFDIWREVQSAGELQYVVDGISVEDLIADFYGDVQERMIGRPATATELLNEVLTSLRVFPPIVIGDEDELWGTTVIEMWLLLDAAKCAFLREWLEGTSPFWLSSILRMWTLIEGFKRELLRAHLYISGRDDNDAHLAARTLLAFWDAAFPEHDFGLIL